MLTAYQVATGAYITEEGTLLCEECFEAGDDYARPISNYGLDEWQTESAEGWLDWDYLDERAEDEDGTVYAFEPVSEVWHQEACGCEPALYDDAGHELREEYQDQGCTQIRPGTEDE